MAVSHYMMVPLQHNLCHSYCIISYYIANCLKFSMVLQIRSKQIFDAWVLNHKEKSRHTLHYRRRISPITVFVASQSIWGLHYYSNYRTLAAKSWLFLRDALFLLSTSIISLLWNSIAYLASFNNFLKYADGNESDESAESEKPAPKPKPKAKDTNKYGQLTSLLLGNSVKKPVKKKPELSEEEQFKLAVAKAKGRWWNWA